MFGITAFAQAPFAALGGNTYNQNLSDSVASADVVSLDFIQATNIAESIASADTQTTTQDLVALQNESIGPVDTPSATQIRVAFQAESMLAAENITELTGKFVNMSESVALGDDYALSNNIFGVSVSESTTPSDIDSSTGIVVLKGVDESLSAADSQTVFQTLIAAVAEATTGVDVYTGERTLVAAINENATISQLINAANNANSNVSESITTADAFTGNRVYSFFISESVSPADTQIGVFNFISSVAETVVAADNVTFTVDTRALPTGVLITLSVSNVNVWGNINDNSNPNWVIIKD